MAVIDFEGIKGNFALKFSQLVLSLCRTGFTAKGAVFIAQVLVGPSIKLHKEIIA